ncbi:MAG TPA: hypothetical protein VF007_06350 [Stellaceae bacterium]
MRDVIAAMFAGAILAWPIAGAAQGTTAFDGTYRGVSVTVAKYSANNPYREGRCPPPSHPRPATLRIANGVVRGGPFEGTIASDGALKMRTESAFVVEGRIDGQGSLRAQGSGSHCVWNYVWQKAG